MSPLASKSVRLGQTVATLASAVLSLWICVMAQASSPDYRQLFLSATLLVAINAALIAVVCLSKRSVRVLLVLTPACLALASYVEMAFRVIGGLRLF